MARLTKNARTRRSAKGTTLAEFGPAMFLAFIILGFPLITFGTLAMRYSFLCNAARLAASAGSQCKTFMVDTNSTSDPSAVTAANNIVKQSVNSFKGVGSTKVTCYIVSTPLGGGSVSRTTSPLTKPADTSSNAYNMEVKVDGSVQPLFYNSSKLFGSIPGLTGAINTSVRADVFFENTQGLNQ